MSSNGASAFLAGLVGAEVSHLFTLPGTQTLPLLRLIAEQSTIIPVFVRSEQAAAFGAVGFARATGRPGVCLSIPGPGATNMASGVAAAHADAIPLVAITPQLDEHMLGRYAVHDCDLLRVFAPIVKAQLVVESAAQLESMIVEASRLARQAPMGPVHLLYSQSLLNSATGADAVAASPTVTEPLPDISVAGAAIAEQLERAQRPVLYVGSEVSRRGADDLLRTLAEHFDTPVFTDEDARGVVSETHPLALGTASHDAAVQAVEQADFCLAVGTRFSEWSTKSWSIKLPVELAHVTESASAIGRSYPATISLAAPVDVVLRDLVARTADAHVSRARWWPVAAPSSTDSNDSAGSSAMHPADVADALAEVLTPDSLLTLDGSSSAMWMSERYHVRQPSTFLQSEVFREIGSALLMGLGAAVARPDRQVVVIQGDGGMLFQLGELSSVAQAGVRLILIVFEDGYYNADRLFQEHVYGGRLSDSAVHNPDYVTVARSFGLRGERVTTAGQLQAVVRDAYRADAATLIVVPTIATAAPARLRERFVEWRLRLGSAAGSKGE